jgi:molybdopterin-binding protein
MNTLNACVTTIDNSSHLCALGVSYGNDLFELILVETSSLHSGDAVTLVFKETEVILEKSPGQVSSANTQKGIIQSIESGIVLTSVTLFYHEISIVSLITTNAYKRLELSVGDEVVWMVQPSEISLLRGHDGV